MEADPNGQTSPSNSLPPAILSSTASAQATHKDIDDTQLLAIPLSIKHPTDDSSARSSCTAARPFASNLASGDQPLYGELVGPPTPGVTLLNLSSPPAEQRGSGYDRFLSGYLDLYHQEQAMSGRPPGVQDSQNADFSNVPMPPQHRHHMHPAGPAGSLFSRLQQERNQGVTSQPDAHSDPPWGRSQSPEFFRRPVAAPAAEQSQPERDPSMSPPMHPGMPPMPSHNHAGWGQDRGYGQQQSHQADSRQPQARYAGGAAAVGGAAGAAAGYGAAQQQQFSPPGNMGLYGHAAGYGGPQPSTPPEAYAQGLIDETGRNSPFVPYRSNINSQASDNSQDALASNGIAPGIAPPPSAHGAYSDRTPSPSRYSPSQLPHRPYADSPAASHTLSREHLDNMVFLDPNSLADDGDDGLGPAENAKRGSKISLGRISKNGSSTHVTAAPAAAAAIAAAAATPGVLHKANPGGNYASVPGGGGGTGVTEKSAWLQDNEAKSRSRKKWLFIILGILILIGIAAGTVGGILGTRKSSKSGGSGGGGSSGQTAEQDDGSGDLSINSAEIKQLMNNKNLHKVFSGMAYTPFASQYPDCLTNKPSQNNVTRDMAVMSQITNVVRLYGTDCNQTQMVLHAIDRLQLKDMKVWLGVWLEANQTTNDRQMAQMWEIVDSPTYGTKNLKGIAVGNEVLFRKDLTSAQLGKILSDVKSNLTSKGINLPVATSDLGDNWTQSLASEVDVVMSNVHPFFGGVAVDNAASWTWTFWQTHDVVVTSGMSGKSHIVSEVGWPSQGGNDCAPQLTCPDSTSGAVASIPNLNKFMDDWVCQALNNGTDYFWFEAFDEPWKIRFDTDSQQWEDHWGLFDINRNLKSGVTIPNCGGKTVS